MPELSAYKKILKLMPSYKELRFFAEIVVSHYYADLEKGSPDIVVIGSNIPEELILAARTAQYWILGGAGVH